MAYQLLPPNRDPGCDIRIARIDTHHTQPSAVPCLQKVRAKRIPCCRRPSQWAKTRRPAVWAPQRHSLSSPSLLRCSSAPRCHARHYLSLMTYQLLPPNRDLGRDIGIVPHGQVSHRAPGCPSHVYRVSYGGRPRLLIYQGAIRERLGANGGQVWTTQP
jgi:hypothetical protein